ncbi:MAG: hypothetical protein P1U74_08755 [Legionellaceae bacterium]|nr:hypothetical protein [Legionellaceae bacterium]
MVRELMPTRRKLSILSSSTIQKMITIYKFAFIEVLILFTITFSQTIYKKLVYGVWEQHGLILKSSMGLTAHVLTAIIFTLLFLLQFMFGIYQGKNHLFARLHIILGQFLILFTLIFITMAAWAVVAREFNSISIELVFYMDLLFISIFFIRGIIAIKQKRYSDHIDSMLGVFMISARSAMFRFAYVAIVTLYGSAPIKVGTLAFIVNLFLYINLFIFYFLANRWKENRVIVISQAAFSSIFLVCVIIINQPITHLFFIGS